MMTLADDSCGASLNDSKMKVIKGSDVSPVDNRGGKRTSTPINGEINKVLSGLSSVDVVNLCNENDGSFIKVPLDNSPCSDRQSNPVATSCDLKTSLDNTGIMNEKGMTGPSVGSKLASMEDVVNTCFVSPSPMDGIVSDKDGSKFEFGRNTYSKGYEEMALKMEYVPSTVSKLENGNRRIMITAEEVIKGGQSCSLQLYGYFVGTSMDYRVVRGNLMRMWRVYDIEEITKTSSGIFYFKFKSKEGMKSVLESGPWMVQNVPLVLNIWEPGIWLEKTKPSSIPIWVCVHNIPMELCNDNGIGKIMSGVGKRKWGPMDPKSNAIGSDEDGFVQVGKKNKPIVTPSKDGFFKNVNGGHKGVELDRSNGNLKSSQKQDSNQMKSSFGYGKYGNQQRFFHEKQGNFQGNNRGNVGGKWKSNQAGSTYIKKSNDQAASVSGVSKGSTKDSNSKGKHDLRQLSNDPNFKPKVLVRGEKSDKIKDKSNVEEFDSIWLDLKSEVDILMEADMENDAAQVKNVSNGDFNTTLDPSKKSTGGSKVTTAMTDFRDCVGEIEVDDIYMSGLCFTWKKCSGKEGGLLKKLDRVMDNVAFMSAFPTSYAQFLPFMTSDHSLAVFAIPEVDKVKPRPFKFHNYLTGKGNLFDNVEKLGRDLASIQAALVYNPNSKDLREAELACLKAYKAALKDEELFLRQKSKIIWLSEGDRNSKYFHNVVKGRVNRGRISVNVLGKSSVVLPVNNPELLFINKLAEGDANFMVREVSNDEVKATLFDIDSNKAHGSDGYSSYFFKSSWDVIGKDFCMAVKEFFSLGKLLKENALDEFGSVSGLFLSFPKSTVFFWNVKESSKAKILNVMPFSEGNLSVRYLGVPLISMRLYVNDCFALVDKVKKRLLDWKNKSLSFAGRLQLIMSVVGSMQVYWSSRFILPVTISNEVETLMRDFLRNYGEFKRGKSRIKWSL
ncbi:putative reverse transcriptase domain-containing protein [Tanacetum coccineum]